MPELRAKNRARIPRRKFGLPEKAQTTEAKKESGNYPMPDKRHAANAKARATQQRKQGNITPAQHKKITRKADRILEKD